MTLLIQDFLRNTPNGVEELKAQYSIDAKRHNKYPNLVLFKYSQIDSPFSVPLVREARGIILNESDNWNVVCYAFPKFFNYGETHAANIDWMSAEVLEKIDGSLCQLFWYNNEWQLATSGTPDGSGQVNDFGKTFAELFWETAKAQGLRTEYLGSDFCWIFELTTPYNRVVVQQDSCKIWALTSRHIGTLRECPITQSFGKTCNVFMPKRFPLHSISECVKAAEALNPLQQEGFVVVDKYRNRVKVKSPAYVMLHHAKDSLSRKRMCEIIRKGEAEEFRVAIESIPELQKLFKELATKHEAALFLATETYGSIKDIDNQKEFAIMANKTDVPSVLFQMRKTGQTAAQCFASEKMSIEHYMKVLGV
jgi:hypothetical protein